MDADVGGGLCGFCLVFFVLRGDTRIGGAGWLCVCVLADGWVCLGILDFPQDGMALGFGIAAWF